MTIQIEVYGMDEERLNKIVEYRKRHGFISTPEETASMLLSQALFEREKLIDIESDCLRQQKN